MKNEIIKRLIEIEREEDVKIFFACESGSRAWGFPSSDSDYDVRFLYLHPLKWYLSVDLENKRDVIERSIMDELDINGWDLRKALKLLRKGNPPLVEWLGSPIIYREQYAIAAQMRELTAAYYTPVSTLYHYYKMAKGNYREYLQGPVVWIKKYFYVLRPLLAIKWIERDLGVVPTAFQTLVDKTVDSPELKTEIQLLIASKREGDELDRGYRIEPISSFIEGELQRLEDVHFERHFQNPKSPVEDFNRVFRTALNELWE